MLQKVSVSNNFFKLITLIFFFIYVQKYKKKYYSI